ncbi:MAG: ABC transporter permease [Deltaproteobacteria bacterium]|nr:ABC transporter permease [Deltaproteobacteria bacterium]
MAVSLRVDLYEGARIAVLSLGLNRLRTLLTTLGIGIGVATLLCILGIVQGLNASFATQLSALGSSTLWVSKFPWVITGDKWWIYRNRKDFTLDDVQAIREQSRFAAAVAPEIGRGGSVSYGDRGLSRVRIIGSTGDYLTVSGFEIQSGRAITDADSEYRKNVVVIGADLVDTLFPHSDPIGAVIRLRDLPFEVVGTLVRRGKFLGESQDTSVIIPFRTFIADYGKRRGFEIGVAVENTDLLNQAEDELIGIIRRSRGTPPEAESDFEVNRSEQLAKTYQQLTAALYGVAIGVGGITLLVGGFGIMNIMLVSVRERTREIGVRRALGARRRTVIVQFLLEAVAVAAVGGAIGTIVGLAGAKLVASITPLAAAVDPSTVLFGVGFSSLVGLLFGIWPAARAAALDPVESLRWE